MATIRRNTAPEKEKMVGILLPTSQTGTKRANHDSTTVPQKRVPSYPRSTLHSSNDVSKQMGKKPAPTRSTTVPKFTLSARRSTLDKTPIMQTQKTRIVSTNNPSVRSSSSSISAKPIVPQKPIPGNNSKVVTKGAVKRTVNKSITTIKNQEITKKSTTTSATKEHKITRSNISKGPQPEIPFKHQEKSSDEKVVTQDVLKRTINKSSTVTKKQEIAKKCTATSATKEEQKNTSSYVSQGPEFEIQPEHQESSAAVSNDEKGTTVDPVAEDQEPLKNIEETEGGSNDKDTKTVIDEDSTVSENQDTPLGIETQESDDRKSYVEDINNKQQESEEHSVNTMNEINSSNDGASVADNPKEEAEEKEVCEVKEAVKENEEEEEDVTAANKKEELAGEIPQESKETEEQVAVDVKKQEPQKIATKQHQLAAHGKKDSAVSNDVIEETASKLREQRKNKVKALAGAFETVISLQ